MRILLLCIFIALVARTRGKSSFSNLPFSGVRGGSQNSRFSPGDGSNGVSAFYNPPNSGANSGRGSSYKVSGTGGNQGGRVRGNAFNLPGPIGGGTFGAPGGNYDPPTNSGSGRSNNKGGGGGMAGSNFQRWTPNVGALPGPIGGGSTLGAPDGNYGSPTNSGSGRSNNKSSGGGTGGSNFQRWTPNVGADLSSLPGPIGGGAGAGSYGAKSASALSNQSGNRGGSSDNNFQSSNSDAVISNFPGPIVGAGGNSLPIGNAGTGYYGARSSSAFSNQGDKRGASGSKNFQGRINNQGGNEVADISSLPLTPIGGVGDFSLPAGNAGANSYGAPASSAFNNQGETDNRGAAGTNSFQVWNSNRNGNRGADASSFLPLGPLQGAGGLVDSYGAPIVNANTADNSFQTHNAHAAHFDNQGSNGGVGGGSVQFLNGVFGGGHNHASNFQGNNAIFDSINNQGGHGGGGFQGYNANAGNALDHSPIGGFGSGSFQGYYANAGNLGNQGGNEGFGGGNSHGFDGNAGNIGNQGGIGAVVASFRGHSSGFGSHGNKGGRSAGSFISRNFGGYSKLSVGSQTSEGLNVDPQLLDRIRTILYLDESRASTTKYGAPSSAYGVPRHGRVIGIQLGGISQSIHIAQFQQTSGLTGGNFPAHTLAIIPSGNYGAP